MQLTNLQLAVVVLAVCASDVMAEAEINGMDGNSTLTEMIESSRRVKRTTLSRYPDAVRLYLETATILAQLIVIRTESTFTEITRNASHPMSISIENVAMTTSSPSLSESLIATSRSCNNFEMVVEALQFVIQGFIQWSQQTTDASLLQFQRTLLVYIYCLALPNTQLRSPGVTQFPSDDTWGRLQTLATLHVRYVTIAMVLENMRNCSTRA